MKILHITETAKGGVGTYINQLVPLQLREFGAGNVRVVAPAQHAAQLADIAAGDMVCFARPGRSISGLFALARLVRREVKAFCPNIIHIHASFAGLLVRVMYGWRRCRPVLIYCPHGWGFTMQVRPAWRWMMAIAERVMAPLCDKVVAISNYEAAAAMRAGIKPGQVDVVRNALGVAPLALPAAQCAGWTDERRKILFIGRLDRQKGFDVLMAAIIGLENEVVLRAAGEAVVGDAKIHGAANVEFLGWLTPAQIEAQLRHADVVVMPSRSEGFGLVALEAMRAGKPVIASFVGGLPEIIEDGVTGRLVLPESAMALRAALLADGAEALAAMGAAGRLRFEQNFRLEVLHERLARLYDAAVQERRGELRKEVVLF